MSKLCDFIIFCRHRTQIQNIYPVFSMTENHFISESELTKCYSENKWKCKAYKSSFKLNPFKSHL